MWLSFLKRSICHVSLFTPPLASLTPPLRWEGSCCAVRAYPHPSQKEGSCCAEYTCFKVICDESAWHPLPFGGQGWASVRMALPSHRRGGVGVGSVIFYDPVRFFAKKLSVSKKCLIFVKRKL